MAKLGPRCGPLLLQFPYFRPSLFSSLYAFLDRLDPYLRRLPADFRYAVEVRNEDWIDAPLLDLLRERRVALALVEMARMPHPADSARDHDLITTDFSYVRLIGDRRAVDARTRTFDRLVLDAGASLDRWSALLDEVLERVGRVYAFANNHYAGHGPATIRDLARRIKERRG